MKSKITTKTENTRVSLGSYVHATNPTRTYKEVKTIIDTILNDKTPNLFPDIVKESQRRVSNLLVKLANLKKDKRIQVALLKTGTVTNSISAFRTADICQEYLNSLLAELIKLKFFCARKLVSDEHAKRSLRERLKDKISSEKFLSLGEQFAELTATVNYVLSVTNAMKEIRTFQMYLIYFKQLQYNPDEMYRFAEIIGKETDKFLNHSPESLDPIHLSHLGILNDSLNIRLYFYKACRMNAELTNASAVFRRVLFEYYIELVLNKQNHLVKEDFKDKTQYFNIAEFVNNQETKNDGIKFRKRYLTKIHDFVLIFIKKTRTLEAVSNASIDSLTSYLKKVNKIYDPKRKPANILKLRKQKRIIVNMAAGVIYNTDLSKGRLSLWKAYDGATLMFWNTMKHILLKHIDKEPLSYSTAYIKNIHEYKLDKNGLLSDIGYKYLNKMARNDILLKLVITSIDESAFHSSKQEGHPITTKLLEHVKSHQKDYIPLLLGLLPTEIDKFVKLINLFPASKPLASTKFGEAFTALLKKYPKALESEATFYQKADPTDRGEIALQKSIYRVILPLLKLSLEDKTKRTPPFTTFDNKLEQEKLIITNDRELGDITSQQEKNRLIHFWKSITTRAVKEFSSKENKKYRHKRTLPKLSFHDLSRLSQYISVLDLQEINAHVATLNFMYHTVIKAKYPEFPEELSLFKIIQLFEQNNPKIPIDIYADLVNRIEEVEEKLNELT